MGYHDIFKGTNYFSGVLVLISASIVCNCCLLFVIVKAKNLHTTPNIYISSIAFANILSSISNGISITMDTLSLANNSLWCSVLTSLNRSFLTTGVFSMVGLCIDRYRFYLRFTTYNFEKNRVVKEVAGIWLFSFVYAAILLAVTLAVTNNGLNIENSSCSVFQEYPDLNVKLRLVDFGIIFTTSAVTMVTALYKVKAASLIHNINSPCFTAENHRKSIKLLISVAAFQWFAGVPFHIYEIVHDLSGSFAGIYLSESTEDIIKLCTVLLAVFSFLILPLIYFAFSHQIKAELTKLCNRQKVHAATDDSAQNNTERWADLVRTHQQAF